MSLTTRKRILAWIIDYGIIAVYATVLFLLTNVILEITSLKPAKNPYIGQLIGFTTLTLPVISYSYFTERSSWAGTVGKRLQKLIVLADQNDRPKYVLFRNILKYLPWEMAHTGVHWSIYYTSNNIEIPIWTWIILIFPQIFVMIYFASILISKGESSFYDYFSNTKIEIKITL